MPSAGRAVAGVVAAALVLFLASCGHGGSHPPASAGTAAGTGSAGPGQAGAATSRSAGGASAAGSARSPSRARSSAPAPAKHADPLSGAAAAYAAGRAGTTLAAVYDIKTGQSWRLGDGRAQAEASVVKLDILETLLARQGGTGLSPGDQSMSRLM